MKNVLAPNDFHVVGNNLALDFANSVIAELTLENLINWAVAVNLFDKNTAKNLLQNWNKKTLGKISNFRDSLRKMVIDLSNGGEIVQKDIDEVNKILKQKNSISVLRQMDEGFARTFEIDLSEPKMLLVPIVEKFVDILCFGNMCNLKKCESDDCILYFYDTTKNHTRRWCSMAHCGNRAKAAKFYQKKKIQS